MQCDYKLMAVQNALEDLHACMKLEGYGSTWR